ncbi:MAG: hypothetical protein U5L46_11755 [Agrobacterium sp.]|nr:hypothetical protein [Agrobacterium sp.]
MSLTVGPFQFGVVSAFCAGNAAKTGSECLPAPHGDIVKTSLSAFTNRRFRQSRSRKAVCGGKFTRSSKSLRNRPILFRKRLQYRRENRNGFRKPQCVLQKKSALNHPAGGSRSRFRRFAAPGFVVIYAS